MKKKVTKNKSKSDENLGVLFDDNENDPCEN